MPPPSAWSPVRVQPEADALTPFQSALMLRPTGVVTAEAMGTPAMVPPFPATVTPLAWFDGCRGSFFSDAAGTIAAPVGGMVRRVNEVTPLGHTWLTPATQLMRRDAGGLNLEPSDNSIGAYPLSSSSNATSLIENDYTLVVSWVQRDGAPQLMRVALPGTGAYPYAVIANSDGFYALSGFTTIVGARHTAGFRFTSTAIIATLWTNGVQTATQTLTMAVSGGSPNTPDYIVGQFQSYFAGILAQLVVVGRAVSPSELTGMMAHVDALPVGPAYPLTQRLLITDGDSIVAGSPGPFLFDAWRYKMLRNIRGSLDAEMLSVAVGGSATAGHFSNAAPFLDSSRPKQIAIFAAGTNDIAGGFGAAALPTYLATLDQYRGAGCKVIAATVLDRTGLLSVSQGQFDADRVTFNAGVRAAASHYDALADTAAISLLGSNGSSANTTYFIGDGVHPTAAGHSLLEAVYRAAVLSV